MGLPLSNSCLPARLVDAVRLSRAFFAVCTYGVQEQSRYNALTNACARGGAWEEALQVLAKMKLGLFRSKYVARSEFLTNILRRCLETKLFHGPCCPCATA